MTTKTQGFTLIELLVAITIGAILLVFSIAPYNFYSEKSRTRLSADRIEQALSKAKLMVASGFAPTGKSVDLVVVLSKGVSRVPTYAVLAGGSGGVIPWAVSPLRRTFEDIPLESNITLSSLSLSDGSTPDSVLLVFRSPTGKMEVWTDDVSPTQSTASFSWGVVGFKWLESGSRSFIFTLPK